MKKILYITSLFLALLTLFFCVKYFFIYKDAMSSFNARKGLEGKIVYGTRGWYIKLIELPSGKNRIIYDCPLSYKSHIRYAYNPYFSPDGKMIVFSQSERLSDDKIYIMDADGSNVKLFLDLGEIGALCPSWSPDSKKIAYVVQEEGRQGLYTIRISDRFIERITNVRPAKRQSAWSPDSKMIAYASHQLQKINSNLYEEIRSSYIINLENGKVEQYIDSASDVAWSSDSKMLAYGDLNGFHVIKLEDVLAGDYIFIPHPKAPSIVGGTIPIRWSPDGKYIVYCQVVWPGVAGIYVSPIDNPKKKIRIGTDHMAIIGMSWAK